MKKIIIVILLCLMPGFAFAQTGFNVLDSIAALKGLGAIAPLKPNTYVKSFHANKNDGGGGSFTYEATCGQATPDELTHYAITGGPSGSCEKRLLAPNEPYSVQWAGAYGDSFVSNTCGVSSTTLTCTGITSANIGNEVICRGVGSTRAGAQNDSLIAAITAASTGTATLSVAATNPLSFTANCVWGHDDTSAINVALAATPPSAILNFPRAGYLISGVFKVGNNSSAWAYHVSGYNGFIYSAQTGHSTNCMEINGGSTAVPVTISDLNVDCMDTGNWGRAFLGGEPITLTNTLINHTYSDCEGYLTSASSFNQQVTQYNSKIWNCGHHSTYANSAAASGNNGFNDEIVYYAPWRSGWGYNSMAIVGQTISAVANNGSGVARLTVTSTAGYNASQHVTVIGTSASSLDGIWPATIVDSTHIDLVGSTYTASTGGMEAPTEQLGAARYHIVTGSGGDNLQVRWHEYGPEENDASRSIAVSYGSDVNFNAMMLANGRLNHVIEGAGNGSVNLADIQVFDFFSPTIEDSTFTSPTIPGYSIGMEAGLIPVGISVYNGANTGSWTAGYTNIPTGANCSTGPCGNKFELIDFGGGIPATHDGHDLSLGGTLIAQQASADQSKGSIQTPTTGATVSFGCTQGTMIVKPAGTLATLTINLPSAASPCTTGYFLKDGQKATVSFTQIISSLTIAAPSGTVSNAPSAATAGQSFSFIWNVGDSTWYPTL